MSASKFNESSVESDVPSNLSRELDQNFNVSSSLNIDVSNEFNEVDEIREWALETHINRHQLDKLLPILKKRVLPSLPKSATTLLGTKRLHEIITIFDIEGDETGEFVYFGIKEGLHRCINPSLHEDRKIFLKFNIDGMSLFKSGKKQFWPILCQIHCNINNLYKPFVVAIYSGDTKPQNINEYMSQFVDELNELLNQQFVVNDVPYVIIIKCFVCDTPARAFCKLSKGHGGYEACERCVIKGERVKNRTVYPDINCAIRTDVTFRLKNNPRHHIGTSPLLLISPKIDMVKFFILDYMHLSSGVMKRLILTWLCGSNKVRLLNCRSKNEITRRMLMLRLCVPLEFQRRPRPLTDVKQWKSTEFRFFLLYCGPIVLKNILPKNYYNHFLLLHVAFRILCSDLYEKYSDLAETYLKTFFMLLPKLYGSEFQILNMHNLIHIASDVKNMECNLTSISCYDFESHLGALRNLIRTPYRPVAQVCRRLQERKTFDIKRPVIPLPFNIIKSETTNLNTNCIFVFKLNVKGIFTITTVEPNNTVLLVDKTVVRINNIFYFPNEPHKIKIQGNALRKVHNVYSYPAGSSKLSIWEARRFSSVEQIFNLESIKHKCIILNLTLNRGSEKKVYVLSMLH